jgi:hypothetical protein
MIMTRDLLYYLLTADRFSLFLYKTTAQSHCFKFACKLYITAYWESQNNFVTRSQYVKRGKENYVPVFWYKYFKTYNLPLRESRYWKLVMNITDFSDVTRCGLVRVLTYERKLLATTDAAQPTWAKSHLYRTQGQNTHRVLCDSSNFSSVIQFISWQENNHIRLEEMPDFY